MFCLRHHTLCFYIYRLQYKLEEKSVTVNSLKRVTSLYEAASKRKFKKKKKSFCFVYCAKMYL